LIYFHRFVRKPFMLNMFIKGIVPFIRGTLFKKRKEKKRKKKSPGMEEEWKSDGAEQL